MKVILLKDVPHVGKKYGVVTVKPGYGRNFLLPRGLAQIASAGAITMAEASAKRRTERLDTTQSQAKEIAQKLKNFQLTVKKKGTTKGHLYGSVTSEDIARSIKQELSIELEPESILLAKPIKTIGKNKITVQLGAETEAHFTVTVEADTSKR